MVAMGPAGTPASVMTYLNSEVNRMLKTPEFREKLVSLGFQPLGGSSDDMKNAIQRDRAKWKKVIDANGIRGE